MTNDEHNPSLPLTSGEVMPVFQAVKIVSELRQLLRQEPDVYHHLVALAEGRADGVPAGCLPELRERMLLDYETNAVLPEVLRVLSAARQVTPGGDVLTNPLIARTPEERLQVRTAEREWDVWGQQVKDIFSQKQPIPKAWVERIEGRSRTVGGDRDGATLW